MNKNNAKKLRLSDIINSPVIKVVSLFFTNLMLSFLLIQDIDKTATEKMVFSISCVTILFTLFYLFYNKMVCNSVRPVERRIAFIPAAIADILFIEKIYSNVYLADLQSDDTSTKMISLLNSFGFTDNNCKIALLAVSVIIGLIAFIGFTMIAETCVHFFNITLNKKDSLLQFEPLSETYSYKRDFHISDFLIAFGLLAFSAVLTSCLLTTGHAWGDDYTCYISEAIALVKHNLASQGEVNSFLLFGKWGGSRIYSLGLPLILTIIYKIFGYDTVNFDSIIYYKIPMVIFLALLSFALYYFFRKYFSKTSSVILTLLITFSNTFIQFTNLVNADIPFMFFTIVALMLIPRLNRKAPLFRQILDAFLIAATTLAAELLRSNGVIILLALLCMHLYLIVSYIVRLLKKSEKFSIKAFVIRAIPNVLPYVFYYILHKIVYSFFPGNPGTGLGNAFIPQKLVSNVITNSQNYIYDLNEFFSNYFPFFSSHLASLFSLIWMFLAIVGMIKLFKREFHLVAYFGGTVVLILIMSMYQELRYFYPVLPLLILFIAYGVKSIIDALHKEYKINSKSAIKVLHSITAVICATTILLACGSAVLNLKHSRVSNIYAYSDNAKEMYTFIQKETNESDLFVFHKQRLLYLNTGRLSLNLIFVDPKEVSNADYFIISKEDYETSSEDSIYSKYISAFNSTEIESKPVFENEDFAIYRIIQN